MSHSVGAIVAAAKNEFGIVGVAPEATIVSLKTGTANGFHTADSVAAALRYAADIGLDIVNLSLYVDPYLFYCKNDKTQKEILDEVAEAARYAQQKGVLIVSAAGNQADDLQHPTFDDTSPNLPGSGFGDAEFREITNACVKIPVELPGVLTVSSVAPLGIKGSTANKQVIARYSSVGMSKVDVAAPGGDFLQATGTAQDLIISASPNTDTPLWYIFNDLETKFQENFTTTDDNGNRWFFYKAPQWQLPW